MRLGNAWYVQWQPEDKTEETPPYNCMFMSNMYILCILYVMWRYAGPAQLSLVRRVLAKKMQYFLYSFFLVNPYKPSVLFVGHRQTVQNQI